ncbi:hypothetical protein [Burkholderia lata]|uniref:hypothetical protein n=1 Tax=Burkholderia lata (strain ATCC 17760 / DSM 23089 / LMG 22485 / NCIMB 9086 / R18194 / 383) TaxID=482957 RepID=UPI001583A422|nr:hypothetical protein [Burkholderia lata]
MFFSLMVLVVSTGSLSGCSVDVPSAENVASSQVFVAPQTSDEILAAISDLINHGDLSDRAFYAHALGVSFTEGVIVNAPLSFNVCGLTMPPEPVFKARRYAFESMPWFVDSSKAGKSPCFADLIERMDGEKVRSAGIQLNLDSDRVCIKQEDILRRFPSVTSTALGTAWTVLAEKLPGKNISVDFLFSSSRKMCASRVNVNQAFKG